MFMRYHSFLLEKVVDDTKHWQACGEVESGGSVHWYAGKLSGCIKVQ